MMNLYVNMGSESKVVLIAHSLSNSGFCTTNKLSKQTIKEALRIK